MKIVLLHQHFKTPATGGAIRSYYLAQALVQHGITTVVVTAHNQKDYKVANVEGIEVHYLPVPYDNAFGFWRRGYSFIQFVVRALNLKDPIEGADLLYAISVPLTIGWAAMRIQRKYGIPYLFEVGDLWPEAPVQMGYITNPLFKHLLYAWEKRIYKSARAVIALSPSIKSEVERKVPGKPVYLIPNMADTQFYHPATRNSSLDERFHTGGKFVVSYIGAIGAANGLDYLLECANACRKAKLPIQFMVCGEGAVKKRLQQHAQHLGLENLSWLEFKDRQGVKELMEITDATFICYKHVPVLETGSPNKFFDGLASGKLIVINFGGWIKQEIEASQCGIAVNPSQPTDFVRQIKPFLDDPTTLYNYQAHARQLAEQKYSRSMLSDEYVALVRESALK